MAYHDSTTATGTGATPSVAVPNGGGASPLQANDIVILACAIDDVTADFQTADWPTGFTELGEVDLTGDGHSFALGWKRLSGADTGTYQFGNIGSGASSTWVTQAFAFRGRHTTNAPVISTIATNNSANASPVSVVANAVTALAADDLLMISAPDVRADGVGNGHTAPTNYTEREDTENSWSNLAGFTRESVTAGSTGSVTATFALTSSSAGWAAALVRIPAAAAGGISTAVGTVSAVASVVGAGRAIDTTKGVSAAVASNAGVGRAINTTSGVSAGIAAATGIGRSIATTRGVSAGVAADAGTGRAFAQTVGNAAGVATVVGVSQTGAFAVGVGVSAGQAAAAAIGRAIAQAAGASSGLAAVVGVSEGGAQTPAPAVVIQVGDGESWQDYVTAEFKRNNVLEYLRKEEKKLETVEKKIVQAKKKLKAERTEGILANLFKLEMKRDEIENKIQAYKVELIPLQAFLDAEIDEDDEEILGMLN